MFAHWFKTTALVAALAAGANASIPPSKMLEELKSKMLEEFLHGNSVTVSSPEIPTERGLRDLKKGKKEKKEKKAAKKGKKEKNGKSSVQPEPEPIPGPPPYLENNVVEVLASLPETIDFSILLGLFDFFLVDTGVQTTWFAPSNEALRESDLPMEEIRERVEKYIGDRPISDFYGTDLDFSEEDTDFLNDHFTQIFLIVSNHEMLSQTVFAKDITDGLEIIDDKGVFFEFQIENDAVTVNGVNIDATDIEAANAVIHIVDGIMLPTEDPNFEVLLGLFNELFVDDWCSDHPDKCVAALSGSAYTFFPPTDGALIPFVGADTAAFVGLVGQEYLNSIMLNHIVEGVFASTDLADGQVLTSMANSPLQISLGERGAFVNDQSLLAVDFFTSEGVYHPIGGLLLPPPV